jgi:uncharacterized protein
MLALYQRALIYHPTRDSRIDVQKAGLPPGQVHTISTRAIDGLALHGWHILPNGQTAASSFACDGELTSGRCLILYFPGNAGHRGYRGLEISIFTQAGANVFLFDYRGYADNAGSPSEERLACDAHAVWDYATTIRKVPPQRVVVYGESIGGGVAVRLAAELCQAGTPPAGLVLRSTFSSLVDAGAYHYPWLPVRWLLVDRFRSDERIGMVTCPVLQLHGTADRIVPIDMGRRLFDAAPNTSASGVPKRFVELPGAGHNDTVYVAVAELRRAVGEFLDLLKEP